jgi:hypothetical protein
MFPIGKKLLIILILNIDLTIMVMTNGNLLLKAMTVSNEQIEEAATYIPFIANLIKGNFTLKEKLDVSRNIYNAYRKQHKSIKIHEDSVKDSEKSHFFKSKTLNRPYYLRF